MFSIEDILTSVDDLPPVNSNPVTVDWLALDHARRSARRAAPGAGDEELDRLIDETLGFVPGRGRSRREALRVNWRGAFVNAARQGGATYLEIAERLRAIEGTARTMTKRQLINCARRASEFERRIDGASWVDLDAGTIRGLSSARQVYRRAQQRMLGRNLALLVAAGSVERVEDFLTGVDAEPSWLCAFGVPESDYRVNAAELRDERRAAVRTRDAVAARYDEQVAAGLQHLQPKHRPAVDRGSRLDELDGLINEQSVEASRDAAGGRRWPRPGGRDLAERVAEGDSDARAPGKAHSRRSRAARRAHSRDSDYVGPRFASSLKTGDVSGRIARLEGALASAPDAATRARLEAQIIGLRQAA
jgi:hypothetical protein